MALAEIVSGEQEAYTIAENEQFLAVLESEPMTLGHTLVMPKQSQGAIFEMENAWLSDFHLFAKQVAIQLKKAIECKKVGLAVVGLIEPHTHIHLIPLNASTDMNFAAPRLNPSIEVMQSVHAAILKQGWVFYYLGYRFESHTLA